MPRLTLSQLHERPAHSPLCSHPGLRFSPFQLLLVNVPFDFRERELGHGLALSAVRPATHIDPWVTYCPPNSCMPSRAKTTMNRKSKKRRLMMDFMELSRDTTRFRREFQYLHWGQAGDAHMAPHRHGCLCLLSSLTPSKASYAGLQLRLTFLHLPCEVQGSSRKWLKTHPHSPTYSWSPPLGCPVQPLSIRYEGEAPDLNNTGS